MAKKVNRKLKDLEHKHPEGIEEIGTVGDELTANFTTGLLTNCRTGKAFQCSPTPSFIIDVLETGGIFPYYNRHVKELSVK